MQLNHRIFKGISPEKLVELSDALQTNVADFAKGCILKIRKAGRKAA